MLRVVAPNAQDEKKSPIDTRRGLEKIAGHEAFDRLRGPLPVQPGDKSRVLGANSFAALPMFGGVFHEDVARQRGFRIPVSSRQEWGTQSGLWLAVVDPDAAVTAPGVAPHVKEEAAGLEASTVRANAAIFGKLFAKWFGNCASSDKETQVLVGNALGYADRYALEADFRRCTSRGGIPNSRASWFTRDVPEGIGNAEWRLRDDVGASYLPPFFRADPYRLAGGMPLSDALRGSLGGQGYAYQCAPRFSVLAFQPAAVWLTPTASFRNRLTSTEVFA